MQKRFGFTLIELLIVVAIIAILAAIAVPNFLEAQTRAKVSRVKSDMRTSATAIESYAVDHNKYPRSYNVGYGDYNVNGENPSGIMSDVVSTPIAYITTARFPDIFANLSPSIRYDEQYFTYQPMWEYIERYPSSAFWLEAVDFYGQWRMCSIGPDRSFSHPDVGSPNAQLVYDPTNGTISTGNVWYAQKGGFNSQPDVGTLIGPSK
jgi:general secretion pathway protein G